MHPYRTHNCGQLRASDVGSTVRLSGWIHRERDHGGVLFIDLRDHYGITQIVADQDNPVQKVLESLKTESVITVRRVASGATKSTRMFGSTTGAPVGSPPYL